MTTATTGTGTITLGAAVSGYLTFALAGVANGDTVDYAILDGSASEHGTGVYTSAGTTLSRSVTKSTNSNNLISLSGSAQVFISPRAETLNDASVITTGTMAQARLGSGSGGAGAKALFDDQTYKTTAAIALSGSASDLSTGVAPIGRMPSGSRVLLNTITISGGSASADDTSSFTAAYAEFEVRLENVVTSGTAAGLYLQIQSGGSFKTTGYSTIFANANSGGSLSASAVTTGLALVNTSGVLNGSGISGTIRCGNLSESAKHCFYGGPFFSQSNTSSPWMGVATSGQWDTSGVVDGIRIIPGAGTLSSGKVFIYGFVA